MCSKHQKAISINKYDLGLAKDFKHKIHLKYNNLVYRKQFKIPEAHLNFIEQSLDEWLNPALLISPILYTIHQYFVSLKNKAKTLELCKILGN